MRTLTRLMFLSHFSCLFAFADRVPGEWLAKLSDGGVVLPTGSVALSGGWVLIRGINRPTARGLLQIQPNFRYRAFGQPDPDFEKSWALNNYGQGADTLAPGTAGIDVGGLKAWAIHDGVDSEVVAVIDSGVDRTHEDLKGNLWVNDREIEGNGKDDDGNGFVDDKFGWNFADSNGDVNDKFGHGTFVAGVIGAIAQNGVGSRGVVGRVRILPIRFLDNSGVGSTASAVAAIDYAVARGATVINASWGGTEYDPALYEAVQRATDKGVVFVAAAGNNGKNNDSDKSPIYPASFKLPTLITVAAYDNRDALVTFSNYGKETVHIGAPGVAIYSTTPGGYRFGEGTSFAAPFVSGAAVLVRGFLPQLTGREVKERILATTEVIHYYEKERLQSGGRLNLFNLLRDIRPPRPKPPTAWTRHNYVAATDHPYANSKPWKFVIEHPGATHVRVHFRGFSTENCCDQVVLKDKSQKKVASYSGKLGDFWSADALGDLLTVEFIPDYSVGDYGFELDASESSEEMTLWSLLDGTGARPGLLFGGFPFHKDSWTSPFPILSDYVLK